MTGEELHRWKTQFEKGRRVQQWVIDLMVLPTPALPSQPYSYKALMVDGVQFCWNGCSVVWSIGNGRGLILPDSYWRSKDNYDPMLRICPAYTDECRFQLLVQPTLKAAAVGAKESWNSFRHNN